VFEKGKIATATQQTWLARLDKFCVVTGALIPTGLVLGNVGFDGVIGLAGLGWLLRLTLSSAWGNPYWRQLVPVLVRHPLVMPWLTWYGIIIISLACNDPVGGKWGYNLVFVRHIIFLSAMLDISRRLPVWKYFLIGLAGGLVWSLINTLSAHLIGYDLIGKPLARYTSHLKEDTRIAHLAAFAAPFYLGRVVLSSELTKVRRRVLFMFALFSVGLVFIAMIRTAIIAMVAGLILPFLFHRRLLRILIPLCLILFIVGGWMFIRNDEIGDLTTLYHRFYMWKLSWQMVLENPLLGVSVTGYKEAFRQFASIELFSQFNLPHPTPTFWAEGYHAHNLFLMVMSVNGILGLAAFSWLLYNAMRLSLSELTHWRIGLASWPVVFLTIGLVGNNIYDGMILALFVFFLVLISCTVKPLRETEESSGKQ